MKEWRSKRRRNKKEEEEETAPAEGEKRKGSLKRKVVTPCGS